MSFAFIFPGQGSQVIGMGADLFSQFPLIVEEASSVLGYSLEELCLQGPEERLNQTQYTQPALYCVSFLAYQAKLAEKCIPSMAAGHSVGEFAALASAKAFSFSDGLKMVAKRSEIMAKVKGGGMAAVIGLNPESIQAVLADNQLDKIDLANFNSPSQIVVSGPALEINNAVQVLKDAGAKLVVPLKVSGAFHSRMMKAPSEEFATYIENFTFSVPKFPVLANVTASEYNTGDEISSLLVKQIHSSVKWSETIQNIRATGMEEFVECGPGNVLTKLLRQIP
jgi:trans-AT polyketide synthase/acyltransferase/oxidoreductase domain-containing protein